MTTLGSERERGGELGYGGAVVAITGAASGIGEATAELLGALGAEVIGLDIATPRAQVPLSRFIQFDLRDETSIARAAESVGTSLDSLFHCAGQPQTAPGLDVLLTGFVGPRLLSELLLPSLVPGGSITHVASTAAYAWTSQLEQIRQLLAQPTFDAAAEWCQAHLGTDGENYALAKGAVSAYTADRSHALARNGLRINCVSPGPTETPMTEAFRQSEPDYMNRLPLPMGRMAAPEEQAWAFAFMGSPRASFITGSTIYVDGGYVAALTMGHVTR
jgi:NAD(P)-dependent dehydrogenase (short-subunit alcohol dehydrogenase family)